MKRSLNNPVLKSKLIEEWNSEQVAIWLTEVGFDSNLADIFKDQEITGDILLELTADSLKELQIDTFGKRFKIQNAITALKNESKVSPVKRSKKKKRLMYVLLVHNGITSDITIIRL